MRLRASHLIVVAVCGLVTAGCGPRAISYVPRGITPLPALDPLAVYMFVDKRGVEERRIGTSFFQGQALQETDPTLVSEPVVVTVTRAFAHGLKARGFPVVDRTSAPFVASQARVEAPVAVSGEIVRFWEQRVTTSGVGGRMESHAECAVLLQAYETASGRPLWDKIYWRAGQTVDGALARTIAAALDDPELIERLGRGIR
jgi:hypothetical protein